MTNELLDEDGNELLDEDGNELLDEDGGALLPINLTGQMSFTGSLTRQVIYNRSMEGVI